MRSSVLMSAEGGRLRGGRRSGRLRVAAAGLAVTGLMALAAGSPPAAHAAFTLNACEGSAIQGEGSSLQNTAQSSFWSAEVFKSPLFGCGPSAPSVAYHSASSGCGLDAVGAGDLASGCSFSATVPSPPAGYRDAIDRFGASDFAPNPQEEASINNGPNGAGNPGSGKIHVIPVAGAAITVVVHFPNGCSLTDPGPGTAASGAGTTNDDTTTGGVNDPTGASTTDSAINETLRLHIPARALEEIWEGHITKWGQIPTPTGSSTLASFIAGTGCATKPIIRVVRQDVSGTTFNFKAYMSLLPSFNSDGGAALWTSSSSQVGNTSTVWPLTSASSVGVPPAVNGSNECLSGGQICQAAKGGGGSLASAIIATDGSIGYLDLATARKEHFDLESGTKDHTYWLPLEPVNPSTTPGTIGTGVFVEPTTKPAAHFNGTLAGEKGANCAGADYRGVPTTPEGDPTLGDWSKAIATGGTTYPVCAITYDLAFDDYATVGAGSEGEARTVRDYLTAITSGGGQQGLKEFDYAILPQGPLDPLVTDAQAGVAAIGWNKTSGAGGKTEETVKQPVAETKTGITTPGVIVATPPSSAFSIAGAKVKGRNIVLSLVLPDAGKVQIKATGGGVTVSNVTASVGGGQGTATLPISSAALKKLAKSKSKKLSVSITVTFTPTGGTVATQTKTLTITQASIAGKSKKKKKGKKKH